MFVATQEPITDCSDKPALMLSEHCNTCQFVVYSLCYRHPVQRVNTFRLLGLNIDDDLKWNSHVNALCCKASSRLYFLKLLKRSCVSESDLLLFYISMIRSVLEYACPVWHTGLTAEQGHRLESVQKRALAIIYGNNNNYIDNCAKANVLTLNTRRDMLCRSFFKQLSRSDNCLDYLLPCSRSTEVTDRLRHCLQRIPPRARTDRYKNSFIVYGIEHYQ